jgi:hypothetical protein
MALNKGQLAIINFSGFETQKLKCFLFLKFSFIRTLEKNKIFNQHVGLSPTKIGTYILTSATICKNFELTTKFKIVLPQ